jgi:hypothetical protein
VLTLHAGLPRARCIPDKARTTFDGVIEGLLALISAFPSVDTDTSVMQGERITVPRFAAEMFEKGGGCLRNCNFDVLQQ